MLIRSYEGKTPKIDPSAWISENAVIIGDVEIGPKANIWYNVVVRGDTNRIVIGAETNVQDGTIIHAETVQGPTLIGSRVTIGHNAIVHGCIVEDEVLISMGAIVLSYAKLGKGCLVAAGALVRENTEVAPGIMVAGIPAKEIGKVSEEMRARISIGCDHYLELAEEYRKKPRG